MDAKQAVEYLKCDGAFMISEKAAKEIASLLESLARDAELGRAAVEVMSTGTFPCGYGIYQGVDKACIDGRCEWLDFCRLRAGKDAKPDANS